MLGKTAGGLYWMFRFLERGENIARLVEAGFRIALTRSTDRASEWKSVVTTAGVLNRYLETHDTFTSANVIDFLLRDRNNPSSVMSVTENARTNARMVRTALTTEVWEAVNDNWMTLKDALKRPIREEELPDLLGTIRQQSALVRGALHGTMLRNDIFDFSCIGTAIERADNTARIIDVKYYTLLPSPKFIGSSLDNVQWETILRSVSAHRSFSWISGGEISAHGIAEFLILDNRLPRSLMFCVKQLVSNLGNLEQDYGQRHPCHDKADAVLTNLNSQTVDTIFSDGLHEVIGKFIVDNNALGAQIEQDYRFNN